MRRIAHATMPSPVGASERMDTVRTFAATVVTSDRTIAIFSYNAKSPVRHRHRLEPTVAGRPDGQ